MNALYNEIEPFAADWLDELARQGHIAPGRVERRSIADLTAADVAGPGQRHFFAGIGVWSYALRLAGVPDDADIWTGSCPCQPFSSAGKGLGVRDPRHLWPAWFALIRECRPPIIFGEQVASKDGLAWLDLVFADLERCGYSVGSADLCAAGVGAPHIRQRLYFVAYAATPGLQRAAWAWRARARRIPGEPCSISKLEHASSARSGRNAGADDCAQGACEGPRPQYRCVGNKPFAASTVRVMGDADGEREDALGGIRGGTSTQRTRSPWEPCDWIPCADGVLRPVEPGTFPLAHGAPARVGRLRGYGNAIVAEQAATFIEAALDAIEAQQGAS